MAKVYTAILIAFLCFQATSVAVYAEVSQSVNALSGDSAVAEWNAFQKLIELGDMAVPAAAQIVYTAERLAPRMIAVEILGRIGTKTAMDALLDLLKQEENLAVRGQICIQLGYGREKRAIPIIAEWLADIGPSSLNDVRGPKEVQPSTCYIRHAEVLGMIGDDSAISVLEEFRENIPKNIGYGGFVTNFVTTAVNQALEDIEDSSAFWQAIDKHEGLAEKIAPVFRYLWSNNLARLQLYESEVLRRTKEGKTILHGLTGQADPELAKAAEALLEKYDDLNIQE